MKVIVSFVAGTVLGAVLIKKFKKDPFNPHAEGWKLRIG